MAFLCESGTANGVIVSKTSGYLPLINSEIQVTVEGQVAITMITQVFKNTFSDSLKIQYAFPMPVEASALSIRYFMHGNWYEAQFAAKEQDSISSGGGSTDNILLSYLGENPLVYSIEQILLPDSTITIELTYVELLPYKFGLVNYYYPNDYSLIQPGAINIQKFDLNLISERTIEAFPIAGKNN